ncbi:hypothetical protein VM1G_08755 [Cytospora mali]|uniref:Uncharacterized protein n=1 Tax=Cytospora mali TaxID=578113 RepID=A0A194WAJ5_CYTMA|nr:hypothetical protein VM1G_08755 [Valsa mali]
MFYGYDIGTLGYTHIVAADERCHCGTVTVTIFQLLCDEVVEGLCIAVQHDEHEDMGPRRGLLLRSRNCNGLLALFSLLASLDEHAHLEAAHACEGFKQPSWPARRYGRMRAAVESSIWRLYPLGNSSCDMGFKN